MAIEPYNNSDNGDQENTGTDDLENPLLIQLKKVDESEQDHDSSEKTGEKGSIGMVLLSTAVSVCGSLEFGSCIGYSAPTQTAIREDLNLSLAEYSLFGSILAIGAMVGGITSGQISDYIGRKGAMRLSAGSCIIGWLAVFFSMGALVLDMGRFLTGYGIGIFSFVVPVFIAEIAPTNIRGGLATLNQLMVVIGSSIAFLLGTVITWRSLALTGIIPCIVILFGLFFIPESPRWLAKIGKQKEFEAALRKLRGKDADISGEEAEIQAYIEDQHILPKSHILDLFDKRYIRSVIIYVASFSIGMGAIPWVIMSEIFPLNVKGVAGSLVVLVSWLGAWTVSYTFNFLMSWSSTATFFFYSAFCAMTVVFVEKVVPETKGKTLGEIQASINK